MKNQARKTTPEARLLLFGDRKAHTSFISVLHREIHFIHSPVQANPQTEGMKHSASGLDPQHSWAKVHPLCMGLWANSSYCLKGRGKVGIRRLHHTHTYLLHQQDRQDQGTAGQEPGHELVLLYPASCNCFSSHLTYFCSCYPKLLAQPCVLVTPSWTGREVKASQPCSCCSSPSTALLQMSPGSGKHKAV